MDELRSRTVPSEEEFSLKQRNRNENLIKKIIKIVKKKLIRLKDRVLLSADESESAMSFQRITTSTLGTHTNILTSEVTHTVEAPVCESVLGKFPLGQFPPDSSPPDNFPTRTLPTGQFPSPGHFPSKK